MLSLIVITVIFSISISALCSLVEAALYAVPLGYVRHLADSGYKTGIALLKLKSDVGRPIAAILILNTVANTAGAALAGAEVVKLYGDGALVVFSVIFTLCVLYASEIIPKIIGVTYSRAVARFAAYPLLVMITLLFPLIQLSQAVSRLFRAKNAGPTISKEEVLSIAALGGEVGAIDELEGSIIKNIIGMDRVMVKDVLTPRVVVFRLSEDTKLHEISEDVSNWNYSRVPIFSPTHPDNLVGYVNQRDIYRELLRGNAEKSLKELKRPLETVPELMRADKLLLHMFEKKEHICTVVDEHGGLAGIVTLEDIVEEIVGHEIVDEYDTVSDLRTFARILRVAKNRERK